MYVTYKYYNTLYVVFQKLNFLFSRGARTNVAWVMRNDYILKTYLNAKSKTIQLEIYQNFCTLGSNWRNYLFAQVIFLVNMIPYLRNFSISPIHPRKYIYFNIIQQF